MAKFRPINLTKTECKVIDSNLVNIKVCGVERKNSSEPVINIHVQLLKRINSIVINAKLYRKIGKKVQPFLYNDVIDFCNIRSKTLRGNFWSTYYDKFSKFTNMNHSCPYEDDIIVRNMTFDDETFQIFPMPKGKYMIEWIYVMNGNRACQIQMFCDRL
ncbi:uncharacterized protein LOC133323787 [Musca vetustissima]|uniref:uncharacterized protein LOC133323787 n=1 Tax=Musca vetustissima TaxID=27455 RepID=UPI002AB7175C|nr:uncharacterized protein LOC133323787 [Musca vetustissima]